ncbi:tRNA pseudouridine(13) synthase TruD [Psychrobacter sp. CAL346-MNA-CIBAN-0220]|uniref:tRNA pseudouridine(13) synthase TruD n=1 Tax=Psychrobacter sp. CAL346-MNA-CIBAN-0220 TaxID=3140457 RepID=UPI00331E1586
MPSQETDISIPTPQPATDKELFDKEPIDSASFDFAALTDTSQLPQRMLPPLKQATYKTCAQDFIVNEVLPNTFTGEGEHLWLHMQKIGMNTAYLAKLLSEWADIPLRDVGYSGLKDRHALTTQWFSLRLPKKHLPPTTFAPVDLGDNESVQILTQQWHNKKLNRGAHRANQFIITLRDIQFEADILSVEQQPAEQQQLIEKHLQHMSQYGVPNYFGPQRFGHYGNNIREALRLFARPPQKNIPSQKKSKRKRPPREQNAMPLSAARSLIFNHILAARVRDGSWNNGMAGEVFNLNGSGSIFSSEQMDDTLRARIAEGDIHPTSVLWGVGNDKVCGAAAKIENDIVQQSPLLTQLAMGLEQRDIKAQRRSLRLLIEEMAWEWVDEQTLVLRFSLPTGSFATSVLASLVQDLQMSAAY